ncbi:histidine phosphatase family protein [Thiorhodococcus mannitoliphagus]|uniref:Histidine phosphatase family protein n=1 Tax=Thiorhodococcus mannitoliphagus TaxID=329406 RepID=A0A6P1DSY0_9GAMM|nr:histidine phosphatase family protein [Thiorhodococcus mannitoliphagus]
MGRIANLYLVRHAEANWSADSEDPSLTSIGKYQAEIIANKLLEKSVTKIVTSPMRRAEETSRIIASFLEVPIIRNKLFCEISSVNYGFSIISDVMQSILLSDNNLCAVSHGGLLRLIAESLGVDRFLLDRSRDRHGSAHALGEVWQLNLLEKKHRFYAKVGTQSESRPSFINLRLIGNE